MTFTDTVKQILLADESPMTPQEIRDRIKARHPEFYGTESHKRNVERGHYQSIDHALLAQIYSLVRTNDSFYCNKATTPMRVSLAADEIKEAGPTIEEFERDERAQHVIKPSVNVLIAYLKKWDNLENYKLQESSLSLLFNHLCPKNTKIEHILLKVSALNDFYSTNIFDTYTVSKHILRNKIDANLHSGNHKVVNTIAEVTIKNKKKNFYSFASKYCSHHKPELYPIYDSFVEKMLLHYKDVDKFDTFKKEELKNYQRFIEIIQKFKEFYQLAKFSLRQIDIFLWIAGKEYFPKKYKKA
jgi:hypothetical protein